MNNEVIERYKKYLTNAQVKELAAKAERYKLLNAQSRANAQNSILAQQRQARRGLQNVGLAGREGKLFSGMETARNDALAKAYDTYNQQLRKVEEAQTETEAVRMANATIRARQRAQQDALLAQQQAQAEAMAAQRERNALRNQVRDRNQWNQQMTDTGDAPRKQPTQYEQAMSYALQQGANKADAVEFATQYVQQQKAYEQAKLNASTVQNWQRSMTGKEWDQEQTTPVPPVLYKDYNEKLPEWERLIASEPQGEISPRDSVAKGNRKKAEQARREMAQAQSKIARYSILPKLPAGVGELVVLSDDDFDVRYDAAVKAYNRAMQDAKIARQDNSSTMEDMNPNGIEREATEELAKWIQAKKIRSAYSETAFYYDTFKTVDAAKKYDSKAKEGDYSVDVKAYDREHGTEDSKYAAIVNELSKVLTYTDRAYRYTFRGKIDNNPKYKNFEERIYNDKGNDIAPDEPSLAGKHEKLRAVMVAASYMTDDERARYNSILYQDGVDTADKYFEYLYETVLVDRVSQAIDEDYDATLRRTTKYDEYGNRIGAENGKLTWLAQVGTSALSVPVNIIEGAMEPINSLMQGQRDPVAARLAAVQGSSAQGMRNAVQENYGKWGQFFYGTGMSMADSATVALISGGIGNALQGLGVAANIASKAGSFLGGSILGGSAFNSSYDEALQRGLSPEKARLTAFGNGVNEMLFEAISLDMLVDRFKTGNIVKVSEKAWKNWVVNTLLQAGVEGSEEVFTDMANNLWDKKVNGIYSEELKKLLEYIADGDSYEDAKRKVNAEFAEQLGVSFLGGAISGGVMGGVAGARYNFTMRGFEKQGKSLDSGLRSKIDGFQFKDKQMQGLQKQSKKTNQDYGVLLQGYLAEKYGQFEGNVQQAVKDGTITKEDAALLEKWQKGEVTAEQMQTVNETLAKLDIEPLMEIAQAQQQLQFNQTVGVKNAETLRTFEAKQNEAQQQHDEEVAKIEADETLTDAQKELKKADAYQRMTDAKDKAQEELSAKVGKKFDIKVEKDGMTVKTKKGSGSVTFDFSTYNNGKTENHNTVETMTEREKAALRIAQVVAALNGTNIKVESQFTSRKLADGTVEDLSKKNGYYDPETDTIHVNLNGTNSVLWTISHELTHRLATMNKQGYTELHDAIKNELTKENLTYSEVQTLEHSYQIDKLQEYLNKGMNLWDALVAYEESRGYKGADAEEEVVARCCEQFLAKSTFINSFANKHYKTAKSISAFLTRMNADMQQLFADVNTRSTKAATTRNAQGYYETWNTDVSPEQYILNQMDALDDIARKWENAVKKVDQKRKANESAKAESVKASTMDNETVTLSDLKPRKKFSTQDIVERKGDLIAVHNLSGDQLLKSVELGGFPMPSIAVMKQTQGHERYGDVSVIFGKDTIDPKKSTANKVYGGDAWTPTYPTIEYKPNEKVLEKISDKYYDLRKRFGYDAARPLYKYAETMDDVLNREGGEAAVLDRLYDDDRMMQLYQKDEGVDGVDQKSYRAWINGLFKGIEEKRGIRNSKEYITPSGKRRSFEELHYEETLENVVKSMLQNRNKNIMGSDIWGIAAKRYKSLTEVKKDESRLHHQSPIAYDQARKGYMMKFYNIVDRIYNKSEDNYFIASDIAAENLIDSLRYGGNSKESMLRYLQKYHPRATMSVVDDFVELVKEISEMPTEYFEAKPERAVGIDEIKAVIMPQGKYAELKEKLGERGIPVIEYDKNADTDSIGNNVDRLRALNSDEVSKLRFSTQDIETSDKQYMSLAQKVKDGTATDADKAELRKAVQRVAKRNGYVLATFHGTSEYFNTFNMGVEGIHLGTEAVAKQVANIRYNNRSKQTAYEWKDLRGRIKEIGTETREEILKKAWTDADDYTDEGIEPYSGSVEDDESVVRYVDRVEQAVDRKHGYRLYLNTFDRSVGERVIPLYAKINNPLTINGDIGYWNPFDIAETILDMAVGKASKESNSGRLINITGSEVKLTSAQKRALLDIDQLKRIRLTDEKFQQAWNELANVFESMGFDGIKYRNEFEGNKNSYSYIALRPSDVKSADLVTYDSDGNIIPLSERFKTDRTGEEAWKNEDIRYSMMDKEFRKQPTRPGAIERTYQQGETTANVYGSSVELKGGSLLNRVRMMQNLAEMYGSVTTHATSEKEAEAFKRAGAQRVSDPFVQESENDPGTWEFTHQENKYETDTRYDAKQKRNFANAVLKEVGTYRNFKREDLRVMRAKLEKAFAVLHNAWHGDGDQLVAMEYADKLLDQILNRYTEMSEADAEMRDAILAEMPVKRDARGREYREIEVTAAQMAEIKNKYTVAEYNAALSKALGTRVVVKQTENAQTLEDVFADNPYLEADTNEGDMPTVLLDRAQETVGKRTNPYKAESEERSALKDAMMARALTIVGVEKSSAQKVREAVKQVRAEERAKAKEAAQKKKLAEQMERGEFRAKVRREERARYEKKLDKIKEVKYSKDEQVKKDLLTVAKTNYQRLVNMLANPTEASHVPVQLARQVSEICLALSDLMDADMGKKADSLYDAAKSKRGVINMDKLIDAYKQTFADKETIEQATRENPGYDPRGSFIDMSMYDETLVKMMEGVGELLKGKTVKQMDNYELRALMYTLRGVLHTVYDANKVTIKGEKRFIHKVAEKMVSELQKAKNVFGKKQNAITRFLNQYTIESLGLRRIAKLYSNSDENAEFVKLVDDLNEGAIEVERIALALRKMFDPVTTKYAKDMKTWYGKNAEWIDIGNGVKITKGMRVSLAMHLLNEQNLRNLTERGVTIPNQAEYKRGDYEQAYTDGTIVKMTKEQAQKIVSQMTEAEKAYFEVAKEFFHKRAGYYINRTSLKMLGYAKAIVENYFPIQVDDAYKMIQYDAKNLAKNASVEHPGFLETRKGTANVMYLNDITAVVNRQINGVSKYAGLAIPMRNWNAVMNQWMWHEDANKNWVADKGNVHTELKRQMGVAQIGKSEQGRRAIVSFVDQFVEDLAGASINNANEYVSAATIGQKLTSNYVKAVLTLNARVALSQLASVPTAAAEIPWKYIAQSFAGNVEQHLNRNASNELIDMYTPLFAMRRAGTQTEVSEIMKRKGLSDKAEQKLPWALGWITAMDTAATRRLWYACERWVKGETNIPVGSDEFYKEVAKRYERVIQNTQPNFTVLQRSPALRSKNAAARIITMFGTQRMQNAGVFIESLAEVVQAKDKETRKAALKKFGRTLSGMITAAIVIGLERAIVSALRGRMRPLQDDDKEITAKSVDKYIRGEVATSLAGSFMYVGELYDFVHGIVSGITEGDSGYEQSFALPAAEALSTLIGFFRDKDWQYFKYMQGDHTDHEKWLKTKSFINELMTVASYATGLPLQNASKTILNGWLPLGQDIADAIKTGEFIPYLNQSGKLDSDNTAANYKEWTNEGKKGSVYLYWEKKWKEISNDKKQPNASTLSKMLMRDSSLSADDKAQLYRMLYGEDTVNEGSVVYHPVTESQIKDAQKNKLPIPKHGNVAVDFTDASRYVASTELSDTMYDGFMELVADGVSDDLALVSFKQYAAQKKQGEGANDRFHDWLFTTVSDPHERAVIDMHVIGNTNSVKGDIGYKDGEMSRDYSTKAWYDMSAKPKQYKYAKELASNGLTDDKAIALIQQFKDVKKDDSAQYLKGLTEAQKKIIYEYKGWKW